MYLEGVCRTALATAGLLIISKFEFVRSVLEATKTTTSSQGDMLSVSGAAFGSGSGSGFSRRRRSMSVNRSGEP